MLDSRRAPARSWRSRHPAGAIALTPAPSRRWPRGQAGGASAALSLPIAGPVLSCAASPALRCATGATRPFPGTASLGIAVPGTAGPKLPAGSNTAHSRQSWAPAGSIGPPCPLGWQEHPWEDSLAPGSPGWAFWGPVGCLASASRSRPAGQVPERRGTARAAPSVKEDAPSRHPSVTRPA